MHSKEEKVMKLVEQHRDSIIELTRKLVSFNTTAPNPGEKPVEEKACQEYIADKLEKLGFEIDMWEPDVDRLRKYPFFIPGQNYKDRPVVVGRLEGSGEGRSIILNSHIDVVTPEPVDRWTHDPWGGEIEDGKIYGRGACDMKGGLATMLKAVELVKKVGLELKGNVIVETVTDEELNGMGTAACIEKGYKADAVVIPEPTSLNIWAANRGLLWGKMLIRGRAGHAEIKQPHWTEGGSVNAIEKATKILSTLKELESEWRDRPDKFHERLPTPKIVPVLIKGGEFVATCPEKCEITINAQYMPANRDEKGLGGNVKKEIEEYVKRVAQADPWLRNHPPLFEWFNDLPPAEIESDHPIIKAVVNSAEKVGLATKVTGCDTYCDNVHMINLASVPAICFGPGRVEIAHTIDEFVAIDDLITTTKVLSLLLMDWSGYG